MLSIEYVNNAKSVGLKYNSRKNGNYSEGVIRKMPDIHRHTLWIITKNGRKCMVQGGRLIWLFNIICKP